MQIGPRLYIQRPLIYLSMRRDLCSGQFNFSIELRALFSAEIVCVRLLFCQGTGIRHCDIIHHNGLTHPNQEKF